MDFASIALAILLGLAFTLVPFLFRAGGEGRLRRGVGWYLNVSGEPLEREARARERSAWMRPARTEGAPLRVIALWTIGGLGDLALAGAVWGVFGAWIAAIPIGLVGLALLGMAGEGWRGNRYLARDAAIRAGQLLDGADRAEQRARRMVATGERLKARELLLRAADDLRAYAPGSGRPDEVLERSRTLREAAERL
jgi:hypothetical protein